MSSLRSPNKSPRWAWDHIAALSDVLRRGHGRGKKYFQQLIDEMKEKKGVTQDVDLTAEDLKELGYAVQGRAQVQDYSPGSRRPQSS